MTSSVNLLQSTIESLFQDLTRVNLENLFTFWLTLSASEEAPLLSLKEETVDYLLATLVDYSFMTVKLWYLAFKMCSSLLHGSVKGRSLNFAGKDSLCRLIYKMLASEQELVGDECCGALVEFLRKLSDCVVDTDQECHLKKQLFGILCKSVDADGCVTRSQGPLDAQVAFVEFLISDDLVKCYDLGEFDVSLRKYYTPNNTISINLGVKDQDTFAQQVETNRVYESMIKNYFDHLAKLVQHHIFIYPRLSIKGTTSPRSCFSGVLTSLLCGPGLASSNPSSAYTNLNDKKKTSLFDMSMPNFSIYSSSSQNFNSSQYHAQGMYSSIPSSQTNPQQSNSTGQSVLCNRDMLVCLLLKCAVNLITDIRPNQGHNNAKKKKNTESSDAKASISKYG